MKYEVGTKILCRNVIGTVIENFKLHGDICIEWETGFKTSYDSCWLDENAEVLK